MKVYVVSGDNKFEVGPVLAVFSDETQAKNFSENMRDDYVDPTVEEFTLNEPT